MTFDEYLAVVEGGYPPYEAWIAFLATPEARSATPEELRTLRLICWPPGREPTIAAYQLVLACVRATRP